MALILVLLLLLNSYPLTISRNLVFTSKQISMQNQASVVTNSLSSLEILTEGSVQQVMNLSENMHITRIIVTDTFGKILYDTSVTDSGVGKYALLSEIRRSLEGKDVFYSSYEDGAFISRAAMPIVRKGLIGGAVYLYEYDTEQAAIISGIQANLFRVSLVICAFSIFSAFLFSRFLTSRMKILLGAIKKVRSGEYGYRMDIKGNDEMAQLGREFNSLTDRLQVTDRIRRRFVSDASHELKTPLASIRLLSDSIVQNLNMDTDILKEFVYDIGEEAERLARTTEKLLSLTRLDSVLQSEVSPKTTLVDASAVAFRVLHMLEPLARIEDISLTSSLSDNCIVRITSDDLYAIIFNLVENAIKYNVPGGNVHLMIYQHNDLVRIVVDDTGVGIPESDIGNIFDRFYRVDKARSREAGGSGLGLSIVKETVLAYGGTIEVLARERGTRFRVCFPVQNAEQEDEV